MSPINTKEAGLRNCRFAAFISYSHAADGRLAPAFQAGLQRLAKPWYRLRATRVFRDETGLGVTPELWGTIERALADSAYFILLASPAAAESQWVQQEIDWWLDHRSADRLLIVWTDGEVFWDDATVDFDWAKTTALPRRLQEEFTKEPLYLDLRWARSEADLSLRRPRFADAIARVAATLRGISLDELIGEDVKQHQRTIRLLRCAVATLLVLTLLAVVTAFFAINARRMVEPLARSEQTKALSQANDAKSHELATIALNQQAIDKELSILLAVEALRLQETSEAEGALRQLLASALEPAVILKTPEKSGFGAVFSRDGRKVLAWNPDGNPQICDATTGNVLKELTGHTGYVRRACFSDNGRRVVTAGEDGFVRLWNAADGKSQLALSHPSVSAAILNPDGSRVLSLAIGRDAMLWDASSGAKIAEIDYSSNMMFGDQVRDASFHPDGTRLALCVGYWPAVLETKTGKVVTRLEGHAKGIRSIQYSPDGHWLLTASEDGLARRWRAATGLAQTVYKHDTELREAQFSPDGKWVVGRDGNNLLLVWEADTGRKVAQIEMQPKPEQPVFFIISPNGKCLLAASHGSDTAGIWEVNTGVQLGELVGQEGEIRTLHFSPDGTRAVVGSVLTPPRIYAVEVCASANELRNLAGRRVKRQLTGEERQKYLGTR